MDIKTLEEKVIYFEAQVLKIAKKFKDSSALEKIAQAQEEAKKAYEKARELYEEYFGN